MRDKLTSLLFCLALAAVFTLAVFVPQDARASVQENRALAAFPVPSAARVLSGDYAQDFETYLSDNIGLRSVWVNLATRLQHFDFLPRAADPAAPSVPVGEDDAPVPPEDEAEQFPVTPAVYYPGAPNYYLTESGKLALSEGHIMEIFTANETARGEYSAMLAHYRAALGEDVELSVMLVPTQIEFNATEYRALSDSEQETIDAIYAAAEGYHTVDAYSALRAHSDEYIYFRTDHHWTQLGAYRAYEQWAQEHGLTPVSLNALDYSAYEGFLGYLYNTANVPAYSAYADTIEVYAGENYEARVRDVNGGTVSERTTQLFNIPSSEEMPRYASIFLDGDHALTEIHTDAENGKTLLVIKDSYANVFVPFLANHYETILMIDPRQFDGSVTALCNEYGVDEVMFINYVFTTTFRDFIARMDAII